ARRPELSILVSLRAAGHLRRPLRGLWPCPAPLGHAGMARRRTRPLERPALLRAEPRRHGAIPRARARDTVAAGRVQLAGGARRTGVECRVSVVGRRTAAGERRSADALPPDEPPGVRRRYQEWRAPASSSREVVRVDHPPRAHGLA